VQEKISLFKGVFSIVLEESTNKSYWQGFLQFSTKVRIRTIAPFFENDLNLKGCVTVSTTVKYMQALEESAKFDTYFYINKES
jgi:hypothetical protein